MISAFMTMYQEPEEPEAGDEVQAPVPPEANAYEFQSGGIIDMLEKLKDDFRKQLKDCEKAEMNSAHAYNMIKQDLTDSIDRANSDIEEKTAEKEKKIQKIADDKGLLAATMQDKAQDEKTLSDLEAECSEKGESFKEKQQLRADEIEAIEKAIEILQGEAVSGAAEKPLDLVQTVTALVQLRSSSSGTSADQGIHNRVTSFLTSEARRLHSRKLGLLAEKVA